MEDKKRLFDDIADEVASLLDTEEERDAVLLKICGILHERVEHYDWVGFYLTVPGTEELELGPFIGAPTDHTLIPFGRGICGQAAERRETFVVQDVENETNYLSCSSNVRSEIVVPLMRGAEVLGEIDIDSHILSPFTEEDGRLLEGIAEKVVARLFPE